MKNNNVVVIDGMSFKSVGKESEGFRVVEDINGYFNYINNDNKLFSHDWFLKAEPFKDGFAKIIGLNEGEFTIDTKGNIYEDGVLRSRVNAPIDIEAMFFVVGEAGNGYKIIRIEDDYNYINEYREVVLDFWLKDAGVFDNGFAPIQRKDGKWNFLNIGGGIVSRKWFEKVFDFNGDYALLKAENGKWCLLNKNGEVVDIKTLQPIAEYNI